MAQPKQVDGPVEGADLETLYRRHADWLRQRLGKRVGEEEAADLVQETYLRLTPCPAAMIRSPRSLLMRIANNLLVDVRRRENRHAVYVAERSDHGTCSAHQAAAVELKTIITSMPALYRDVFVLSRFSGMTYPQIARKLGISVKTVEWRMSKALDYCLTQLDS